jgi:hypothetical protein
VTDLDEYVRAMRQMAEVARCNGDFARWRDFARRGYEIVVDREARGQPMSPLRKASSQISLGHAETHGGDLKTARRHLVEATEAFARVGQLGSVCRSRWFEGDWYAASGDDATAALLYRRVLSDFHRYNEDAAARAALDGLIDIAIRQNRGTYCAWLLGAVEAFDALRRPTLSAYQRQEHEGRVRRVEAAIGRERTEFARTRGRALDLPGVIALARDPCTVEDDCLPT